MKEYLINSFFLGNAILWLSGSFLVKGWEKFFLIILGGLFCIVYTKLVMEKEEELSK